MKKFLRISYIIFYQNFLTSTTYLINLLSGLSSRVVRTGALILVWNINIISGSNVYNFSEIFTYYIIGEIFIIPFFFHSMIGTDIMKGSLSPKLLLPYSVWWGYIWEELGAGVLYHLSSLSIALIVAFIFVQSLILPSNLVHALLFLVSVLLGSLISIYMSFALGWVAFYTTNTRGINELFTQVSLGLSGRLIPLETISGLDLLIFNPFAATYFLPMKIYLEKPSVSWVMLALGSQLFWLMVVYIIARVLYHKGLKKYESVGL